MISDPKVAKQFATRLQALAEPNRLRIIQCLRTGSKNVTQLAKELNIEVVNVSHHLSVLREAGLVRDQKRGRYVVYTLNPEVFVNQGNKSLSVNLDWCKIEIPY